jgi:hypothetical protein
MALSNAFAMMREYPGFVVMRSVARFPLVRRIVKGTRSLSHRSRWSDFCAQQSARMNESLFQGVDPLAFVNALRQDGVSLGLQLPNAVVRELRNIAETVVCYADRDCRLGFPLSARLDAERAIGKPILVAQYFNVEEDAPAISRLRDDPFLLLVAARYLESLPTHVGTNMWWTFPVQASREERAKHAHMFHADVDDFAFLKFFFYLTDVEAGDGAHVCVPGSHRRPLVTRFSDRWNVRRYEDEEVETTFGANGAFEIHGPSGTGFAEDTLCIHKGMTPTRNARLLLQLQYALYDHRVQRDHIDPERLERIV